MSNRKTKVLHSIYYYTNPPVPHTIIFYLADLDVCVGLACETGNDGPCMREMKKESGRVQGVQPCKS